MPNFDSDEVQRGWMQRLRTSGIKPLAPNGNDLGRIFLRQDIEDMPN